MDLVFVEVLRIWREARFHIGKCVVRNWESCWEGLVFMSNHLGKEFQFGT